MRCASSCSRRRRTRSGLPLWTDSDSVAVPERGLRARDGGRGRARGRATASRTWRSAICFSKTSAATARSGSLATGLTPMFPLFGVRHGDARRARWLPAACGARLTCVNPKVLDRAICRARVRRVAARRPAGVGRSLRRARRVPFVRLRRPDVQPADRRSNPARSSIGTGSSSPI